MSNLGFQFSILVFIASALLVSSSTGLISAKNDIRWSNQYVAMFVFGDSVYDPGNNNFRNVTIDFRADFWPYGETFFNFSTGRFTDGRIVPDFLSMYLGIPLWRPYLEPGNHSYLHGANFAGGGSAVLESDVYPGTISFTEQLSFFEEVVSSLELELGSDEATTLLNEAIYLSSIGGIDYLTYGGINLNATETEKEEFVAMVIGNITEVIKEIYNLGGRKFAFQNVGPLGCMPFVRQMYGLSEGQCYESLLELASLHNAALINATSDLESQLSGFKYMIFDYYNSLLDRINNPSEYDLTESESACCGNGTYLAADCGIGSYELCSDPNVYLWFDGGHQTDMANMHLASLVWEGGSNATTPYTLKELFELELNLSSPNTWSVI